MNPRAWPTALRTTHIVIGVLIGIAVYAVPLVSAETARLVVAVGIPMLALSGVGLWKQAQLRRLLQRRSR